MVCVLTLSVVDRGLSGWSPSIMVCESVDRGLESQYYGMESQYNGKCAHLECDRS